MFQATIIIALFVILQALGEILYRLRSAPYMVMDYTAKDAVIDNVPQPTARDAKGKFTKKPTEAEIN